MNYVTNPERNPSEVSPCARWDEMRGKQTRGQKIEFELRCEVLENYLSDAGNQNGNENDDTLLGRRQNEKISLHGQGQIKKCAFGEKGIIKKCPPIEKDMIKKCPPLYKGGLQGGEDLLANNI